ncbi:MAG: MBL fold metallo-hydrolase, partial [Parcubacteria group bacterium]|nr:MBL fold metallo-hydrolase [Parcubacteria group bacterium]
MKLYFHGGAGVVTGANYLIECAGTKILVDCGLQQGSRFVEKQNYEPFPYSPAEIDAVFLTHAHIDHVGRLPKLYRDGFRGRVFATYPTLDLARLNLDDSLHILKDEAKGFHEEPLFEEEDVIGCWKLTHGRPYHQEIEISPNVKVRFNDAGHILGSSIIEVFLSEENRRSKIVFSGDLGNPPTPLLKPTESIGSADYVLVESAYGDRLHEDRSRRKEKLEKVIESVIVHGGTLMIPAFAIERTQELLFELNNLVESGRIPKMPVFIDSPLAIKATAVYQKHSDYFNKEAAYLMASGDDLFNFPGLEFSLTTLASKAINDVPPPKVVIAGSGMSEGGRILHHEKRYLPDPKSTLLIIGYQTQGSLGRRLLDGAQDVRMFGEDIPVRAQVKAIGGYSAHADQAALVNWVGRISGLKKVFVVQGEEGPAGALASRIRDEMGLDVEVPQS